MVYKSKYNNKHKKQVILLMIGYGKKYHYLALTNLSGLLKGISSNHIKGFYCLNCFNSYTTENKLKQHEEKCNKHKSCHMEMPEQVILKYNPGEKSLKAPHTICRDLECIFEKVESCQNNPEKSYTENIARQEPSGYTEKYITFSVPIKKELNNGKTVSYKLKFIDSYRFMQNSLSELVDNTSEILKSEKYISCIERKTINSECCFAGLKDD